jgi:hypothetical protein
MGDVKIHPPPVPIWIVFVVTEEVVATVIFAVDAFVIKDDIIPIVAVLITAELVKKANVERLAGIVAIPPPPPTCPRALEKEEIAALILEVTESELMYPIEPKPVTDDKRFGDDTKPAVPNSRWRPPVVDNKLRDERKPAVAYPLVIPPVVETIRSGERIRALFIEETKSC